MTVFDMREKAAVVTVADERFQQNIDKHASGTAAYISRAIQEYCKK